jgi:beta-glucosidase
MPDDSNLLRFPDKFTWGTATSAYQIEGSWNSENRGESIWDNFCHQPRKILGGDTGDVACDHYRRWAEDIKLLVELEQKVYRFSVSWPRIFPFGKGTVNPLGLAFYDRLIDRLLDRKIKPVITLYHWDLPQALEDRGGWTRRDTALHFAEYARVLIRQFGDRVSQWITLEEPYNMVTQGYLTGRYAPGLRDTSLAFPALHNILLGHGLAVKAMRDSARTPIQIGIALNLSPVSPATETDKDRAAAKRYDGLLNRLFLDALYLGQYPEDVLKSIGSDFPSPAPTDMEIIPTPTDFLGVNYSTRSVVQHDPDFRPILASPVYPFGNEYSQMAEIYPTGLYDVLTRLRDEYQPPEIYITKNGVAIADGVDLDRRVRDVRRINYLRDHLVQVHRAIADGVPVSGYFAWSLLDNFEWNYGYRMRYGLTYVDYITQLRTIKDSGRWYAQVAKANGFDPQAPYVPAIS